MLLKTHSRVTAGSLCFSVMMGYSFQLAVAVKRTLELSNVRASSVRTPASTQASGGTRVFKTRAGPQGAINLEGCSVPCLLLRVGIHTEQGLPVEPWQASLSWLPGFCAPRESGFCPWRLQLAWEIRTSPVATLPQGAQSGQKISMKYAYLASGERREPQSLTVRPESMRMEVSCGP